MPCAWSSWGKTPITGVGRPKGWPFGSARRAPAALAAKHLQGNAARPGRAVSALSQSRWQPGEVGANGCCCSTPASPWKRARPPATPGKGWELLTDAVIRHVAEGDRPVVFMLWGSHAQSKRAFIPQGRGTSCSHPTTLASVGLAATRALHWQWPFRPGAGVPGAEPGLRRCPTPSPRWRGWLIPRPWCQGAPQATRSPQPAPAP